MLSTIDLQAQAVDEDGEVIYIPNFVTEEEESYLIRKINDTPHQSWKSLANRRLQIWGGLMTRKNVLLSQSLPPFVEVYPNVIDRLQLTGAFCTSTHGAPNHIIVNEYLPGQGIMPHQDGPAYHPVVATISLGSHTAFHYYKYRTGSPSQDATDVFSPGPQGEARIIDHTPVMSVLLEPRSVIITSGSMYTSHLHGIGNEIVDYFTAGSDDTDPPKFADFNVTVANWRLLGRKDMKEAVINGRFLQRSIRYSLTCRDVEKVANSALLKR
ncbi:hypothetical protein DFJ43DRAFT_1069736 [Lentinula guzmanii]|uniref:Fe2OG dioxygenase domain-containing protein n=1 Tax=Lentinula guzmanii TaxID=2804957 RepID=A0AA38JMR7_9AGAR|nr:hypothetical protein DFJ43DRAFT_1069736 [Lentinula guzmanii]